MGFYTFYGVFTIFIIPQKWQKNKTGNVRARRYNDTIRPRGRAGGAAPQCALGRTPGGRGFADSSIMGKATTPAKAKHTGRGDRFMQQLPWRDAPRVRQVQAELERANRRTSAFGMTLRPQEMRALALRHTEVLHGTGRAEFGESILPKLAFAFCDSPHIAPEEYAATLEELMECFYHFKNETMDAMGDDDLLDYMKNAFNTHCHGSVELLREKALEELALRAHSAGLPPAEEPGGDGEEEDDEW